MTGYKPSITMGKGGKQLINVFSSTTIASFLVLLIKGIMGEELKVETIQEGIDHIAASVLFLTPITSAFIRMATNYIKNRRRVL